MADFQRKEEENIGEDFFDHLPDPILLLIFNKLLDAKSLCRCLLVSKRFATLIPEVDSISLVMNPEKSRKPSGDSSIVRTGSRSASKNFFKSFISKFISKPFQFIGQVLGKKHGTQSWSNDVVIDVFNWVGSALKNFNEIQSLKLELPCHGGGDVGVNKAIPLLKWEAGFGKELERCVILGANSIVEKREKIVKGEDGNDENGDNEPLFSDDELKMRIIWIISCLIASSARHNLLKKIVSDCPKLENAVISDAGKQGKVSMDVGQIRELRDAFKNTTTTNNNNDNPLGTQSGYVGNLVMKLWYVKELELPSCGLVMKGATMVVIRPDGKLGGEEEREREGDGLSLRKVFERDEVFEEAAKELLRMKEKKMYRLEMNSF